MDLGGQDSIHDASPFPSFHFCRPVFLLLFPPALPKQPLRDGRSRHWPRRVGAESRTPDGPFVPRTRRAWSNWISAPRLGRVTQCGTQVAAPRSSGSRSASGNAQRFAPTFSCPFILQPSPVSTAARKRFASRWLNTARPAAPRSRRKGKHTPVFLLTSHPRCAGPSPHPSTLQPQLGARSSVQFCHSCPEVGSAPTGKASVPRGRPPPHGRCPSQVQDVACASDLLGVNRRFRQTPSFGSTNLLEPLIELGKMFY